MAQAARRKKRRKGRKAAPARARGKQTEAEGPWASVTLAGFSETEAPDLYKGQLRRCVARLLVCRSPWPPAGARLWSFSETARMPPAKAERNRPEPTESSDSQE